MAIEVAVLAAVLAVAVVGVLPICSASSWS